VKILLDHNLDWRLSQHLPGHQVKTASEMNWKELVNGLLLKEAETAGFEILLTGDTNINYQQNITGRSISVVVLRAYNNRRKTHIEMMTDVMLVLETVKPGQIVEVFHPDMLQGTQAEPG
jgi:predicted nuclease of predicted toxin-antitoxin system